MKHFERVFEKILKEYEKTNPVKKLKKEDGERLNIDKYPNFHKTGSVKGMKNLYYGKNALLVQCGSYIYNVTDDPDIYYNEAY